jgi:hypothetical protein
MTTAGLTVEELDGRPVIYTDFISGIRAFGLGQTMASAVASGWITDGERDQWVQELQRADRQGRFFASVTGFRSFGRKPA